VRYELSPYIAVTVGDTHQTAASAQDSYCYVRQPAHCSWDKYLARPLKNKKIWKEIIFLPCLDCLLRNGSVNKWCELQTGENLA